MDFMENNELQSEGLKEETSEANILASDAHLPQEATNKKPGFLKRHWLKIVTILIIIGISTFGAYQTIQSYNFYHTASKNKTLYEEEVSLNDKILGENLSLKNELTKTEEGRKSLEKLSNTLNDEKNSLKDENTELDKKNTALDKRATTAEEQYNKAQNDLNAKLAELDNINTELENRNKELLTKKAEIEKANRGIAKFADVEVLISDFEMSNQQYILNINESIKQINNYMSTLYADYLNKANSYLKEAQKQYEIMDDLHIKIKNIFDNIKSGNY